MMIIISHNDQNEIWLAHNDRKSTPKIKATFSDYAERNIPIIAFNLCKTGTHENLNSRLERNRFT